MPVLRAGPDPASRDDGHVTYYALLIVVEASTPEAAEAKVEQADGLVQVTAGSDAGFEFVGDPWPVVPINAWHPFDGGEPFLIEEEPPEFDTKTCLEQRAALG